MKPDWKKVNDFFDLALEQPSASRSTFLRNICGSDISLFNEVESLLKVYDEPQDLIEKNALSFNFTDQYQTNKIPNSPAHVPFSASQLKGDLDNIILMALRKEPLRRYASAADLSEDIEKYLKGLPVSAHQNSFRYRAEKFVTRNKIAVSAFGLILISLISGLAISIWQYKISQREAEKSAAVNSFMQKILLAGNTETISSGKKGYSTTISDVLRDTIKRLENGELDNQPEVKAEVLQLIAEALLTQGEYDPAEKLLRDLLNLKINLYGENSIQLLKTKSALASLLVSKAQIKEAEEIYDQILPKLLQEYRKGEIEPAYLTSALSDYALTCRSRGDSLKAENLYRQTLEIAEESKMAAQYKLGYMALLSLTLMDQGKFAEAEDFLRKSIDILNQQSSIESTEMSNLKTALGSVLMEKGDLPEAQKSLQEAENIYRKLLSPVSLPIFDNLRLQAQCLYFAGKTQEAENKINQVLDGYDKNTNPQYINYATALTVKGLIFNKLSKSEEAEKILRQAVKLRTETLPQNHFMTALTKSALGEILTDRKNFTEAEPFLKEAYESLLFSQGAENPRTVLAKTRLDKLDRVKPKNSIH